MFGTEASNNNGCRPTLFIPFLDHINQFSAGRYNQATINWYKDGSDYTAQHADCEKGMVDDADIAILTLGDSDRVLKIRNLPEMHWSHANTEQY